MAVMYFGIAVVLGVILLALLFRRKRPAIIGYHRTDKELGNSVEIAKEGGFYEFVFNSHKRLGPVFEFWLGNRRAVSIANLEMFKAVKHLPERPHDAFASLIPLVGSQAVFFTNGSEYSRRRKNLHAPFFSISSIYQNLVPRLNEQIEKEVLPFFEARANTGQPTLIHEAAVNFTMRAIVYLVGSNADKSEVQTVIDCHNVVFESLYAKRHGRVLTKEDTAIFGEKLAQMKSVMKKLVAQAKISESPSLLKVYANEDEEVINDDMMSFLVGGFHTTSYLIQFALYLAAKYPEEQEKLYRELRTIEGDVSSKVESLPVLRNFIDEALRWAGISLFSAREDNNKDIVLPGGYVIPKGSQILIPIYQIQHDETVWENPEDFIPDRFNDPESRGLKFCGFGFAGGRTCPGKSMALTEAKLFIAETIRRFAFALPRADYSVKKHYVFVIRPVDPIELIVTRR
jgi:cytochrome P450 family 20 subfamily A